MTSRICLVPSSPGSPLRCELRHEIERALLGVIAVGTGLCGTVFMLLAISGGPASRIVSSKRVVLPLAVYGLAVAGVRMADEILSQQTLGVTRTDDLIIAGVSVVPCMSVLYALLGLSRECHVRRWRKHVVLHRLVRLLVPAVGFVQIVTTLCAARYQSHDGSATAAAAADNQGPHLDPPTIWAFSYVLYGLWITLCCLICGIAASLQVDAPNQVASGVLDAFDDEPEDLHTPTRRLLRRAILGASLLFALQNITAAISAGRYVPLEISGAFLELIAYVILCVACCHSPTPRRIEVRNVFGSRVPTLPRTFCEKAGFSQRTTTQAGPSRSAVFCINAVESPVSSDEQSAARSPPRTYHPLHSDCLSVSFPSSVWRGLDSPSAHESRMTADRDDACSPSSTTRLRKQASPFTTTGHIGESPGRHLKSYSEQDIKTELNHECAKFRASGAPVLAPMPTPAVSKGKVIRRISELRRPSTTDGRSSSSSNVDASGTFSFLGGLTPTYRQTTFAQRRRPSTQESPTASTKEFGASRNHFNTSVDSANTFGEMSMEQKTGGDAAAAQRPVRKQPSPSSSRGGSASKAAVGEAGKLRHTGGVGPRGSAWQQARGGSQPEVPIIEISRFGRSHPRPATATANWAGRSISRSPLAGIRRPPRTAPEQGRLSSLRSELDAWRAVASENDGESRSARDVPSAPTHPTLQLGEASTDLVDLPLFSPTYRNVPPSPNVDPDFLTSTRGEAFSPRASSQLSRADRQSESQEAE